jgi:RimJ/RimL family protein N-acetyltransferase
MVMEVMKFGFNELKLHRITLGVYDNNTSALRCYQSAGFSIDGKMRDILRFRDEWWTLIEMSILEDEWKYMHSAPDVL